MADNKAAQTRVSSPLNGNLAGWGMRDRHGRWTKLDVCWNCKQKSAGQCFAEEMCLGNSKTAMISTKMPQFSRKKYANFPQKYANQDFLTAAICACSKLHQTTPCENETSFSSERNACFKLAIFEHFEYSCIFRVLSRWWLQSPTQTLNIWGRRCVITSNSNAKLPGAYCGKIIWLHQRWQSKLL